MGDADVRLLQLLLRWRLLLQVQPHAEHPSSQLLFLLLLPHLRASHGISGLNALLGDSIADRGRTVLPRGPDERKQGTC